VRRLKLTQMQKTILTQRARVRACQLFLVLAQAAMSVWAAPGGDNEPGKGKGKAPAIADRPVIEPRANSDGFADKGKSGRAERVMAAPAVRDLVGKFQTAREAYLEEQRQLRVQLKDATEAEREGIRQQMRAGLERWKEQTRLFAEETRERAQKMKDKLGPDLGRVIEKGRDEGRNR